MMDSHSLEQSGEREDRTQRLKEHTLPFLMSLLNCTEEQAMKASLSWQTFCDDDGRKEQGLIHQLHGSIGKLGDLLDELNQAGAGIFLTINKTDLKGRSKQNIRSLRSLWADLDEKDAAEKFQPESLVIKPTIMVRTGHGQHLYWCLTEKVEATKDTVDLHESSLRGIQQALAPYGADRAVCEVARVMRVPGFYNMKREPYPLVKLLLSNGPRYSMEQIGEGFPPVGKQGRSGQNPRKETGAARSGEGQPEIDGMDRSEILRLAVLYLDECPPAISDHGGHDTTFLNALKVISGFDLTMDEALGLLQTHFNERCEPPWSEAELIHKVEDAHRIAQEDSSNKPKRGWLLRRMLKPKILIGPEHIVVGESIQALAPHGDIYSRKGALYRVIEKGAPGSTETQRHRHSYPTLEPVNPHWLRERLSLRADFCKINEKGDPTPRAVPEWLPPMLIARRQWDEIEELKALVETPVFLPGGRVLSESGFDEESGLYVSLSRNHYPDMPLNPSRSAAEAALADLFAVVEDFHFASDPSPECHRAAWLAFVMTLAARFAIDGPVPFALFDASMPGSGKGLLTRISCLIGLGRVVPTMSCVEDEEEMRKRILLPLMYADRVAWIDDAPSPFGGNTWNALMTSWPEYRDRILGKSEAMIVPATTVWAVTGNNLSMKGDSTRRALNIRLEPQVEHPEEREDFRIADLASYVDQHHPALLNSVLTILRAYHLAGSPSSDLPPLGSFEAWSRQIRDCVFWITGEDVCQTQRTLGSIADENRIAAKTMLDGIFRLVGDKTFTCQDLFVKLSSDPPPTRAALQARNAADQLKRGTADLSTKSLGHILGRLRGQIVGEYQLQVAASRSQGNTYQIVRHEVPEVSEVLLPSQGEKDDWAELANDDPSGDFLSKEEKKPQEPQKPQPLVPSAPAPVSLTESNKPIVPALGLVLAKFPLAPQRKPDFSWTDDKEEDERFKDNIMAGLHW